MRRGAWRPAAHLRPRMPSEFVGPNLHNNVERPTFFHRSGMTWRGTADERSNLQMDKFDGVPVSYKLQRCAMFVSFLYCGGGSIPIPIPNFFPELRHGVRSCPRQAPSLLPLSAAALSLTGKEGKQARRSALARRRSRCPGVDSSAGDIEREGGRARVVWTHF